MTRKNAEHDTDAEKVTDAIIPVIEERVIIDKRKVATGTVTVSIHPTQKTQTESVDLRRVTYREERHAVDKIIEAIPDVRREGDVTIIPVVKEEVVITKRLRLVEEIHLIREERIENSIEEVSIREDEVTISRE